MTQKIVAFVAKSFAPEDEAKIAPIIKCLEAFNKLGFIWMSAEKAEVESVSEKVRSRIDESHLLVGILTRRHPVYRIQGRFGAAANLIFGKLRPSFWTAPPWVLQESGYALKSKGTKSLILFLEAGVEPPGLQGDLEYIPFDPLNPAPALQRASEMITDLIAKTQRISVETVVQSEAIGPKQSEVVTPPAHTEGETKLDEEGVNVDFHMRYFTLIRTAATRDWEEIERVYADSLSWIHEHRPERELDWQCFYQKILFFEGQTEALGRLRDLAAENANKYLPLSYLAACYVELREYDNATKYYLHAASIAGPRHRAALELDAAEVMQKAKKIAQASTLLLNLRGVDYAQDERTQFRILERLYSLWKDSEDKFTQFAIAELALRHAPEESHFRFSVAYDYDSGNLAHLSAYHYKIICDQDDKNGGAFNNLGIALGNCNFPVLAVQRFKQSLALGESLAASNLGRKYIDAGLTDEALALLRDIHTKENCSPEVTRAIASAHEKIEQSAKGQEAILARAEAEREFLIAFAEGRLSTSLVDLDGKWTFPNAALELKKKADTLVGFKETRAQVKPSLGLGALYGDAPRFVTQVESCEFSGTLSGRTCRFKFVSKQYQEPSGWSILGGRNDSTVEGYIHFSEDGLSGRVVELAEGKPENYYEIRKDVGRAQNGPDPDSN